MASNLPILHTTESDVVDALMIVEIEKKEKKKPQAWTTLAPC